MAFDKHLFRKLLLPGLLDELDMQGPQRNDCLNLPKSETILQGSGLMKEFARHSAGHRKKKVTDKLRI